MFKNLPTGTKLLILCGVFMVATALPIYDLVIEKQVAINFTKKELVGTRYLAALHGIYATTLTSQLSNGSSDQAGSSANEAQKALAAAQTDAAKILQTAELEQALMGTLRELWSREAIRPMIETFLVDALALARDLILRIGDDSKLAIDPDLDTYYLQDIAVRKLPAIMGQLGETQTLLRTVAAAGALSSERKVRFLILDSLLRSTAIEVKDALAAAYRGTTDGTLKRNLDADIAAMVATVGLYLSAVDASLINEAVNHTGIASFNDPYRTAVDNALGAWAITVTELDRLLHQRIDNLTSRLYRSLMVISALVALSILVAIMTHRYIVRPLRRLEGVARTVYNTQNYGLRIEYQSNDEIGHVAVAFNEMLGELAVAREREIAQHLVLARAARLTTIGEMTASIAHEINQPLSAIVTNGNAGLRWLGRAPPDLDEVKALLKRVVNDGNRASQVIGSIRAMFKKSGERKVPIDVNELIREVLMLVRGELKRHRVLVRTELAEGLPRVSADRVQVQQVIVNLITNAIEAMGSVTDRERILRVASEVHESRGVLITVEDSGTGIDPKDINRVFERLFTTKSDGMGMGLAICRSIVEAHNGRLWAEPGVRQGSVFRLLLPITPSPATCTDDHTETAVRAL
jgi:signal transduction histidine kinase